MELKKTLRDLYKQIIGGLGTHVVEGVEFVDPTNDLIKLQQTIGRGVRDPNRPLIVCLPTFLPKTNATSHDSQQAMQDQDMEAMTQFVHALGFMDPIILRRLRLETKQGMPSKPTLPFWSHGFCRKIREVVFWRVWVETEIKAWCKVNDKECEVTVIQPGCELSCVSVEPKEDFHVASFWRRDKCLDVIKLIGYDGKIWTRAEKVALVW